MMREMEIPFQVKKPTIPCQNSESMSVFGLDLGLQVLGTAGAGIANRVSLAAAARSLKPLAR